MTTSYNYFKTDRQAIQAAFVAQLATAYMAANLSTNWRGWKDISQQLDLGTKGALSAQACGAIWHLQATRPPHRVGDIEAPWARDYMLTAYFRRQSDPTSLAIVDAFDELLKTRLKDYWAADATRRPYDLSAPWSVQEIGDTWVETVHVIRFSMVN